MAPGEGLLRLLAVLGYLAVVLLVVAGLAFLLSVTTDAALGAVGGAVLLWILSSILDQITALGGLRDFLPTHYSSAWLGLLSTPVQTDDVVRGCDLGGQLRDGLLGAGLLALHPQGRHLIAGCPAPGSRPPGPRTASPVSGAVGARTFGRPPGADAEPAGGAEVDRPVQLDRLGRPARHRGRPPGSGRWRRAPWRR